MQNTNYLKLEQLQKKISLVGNILGLAHWDFSVNIPAKSADARLDEIANLVTIQNQMLKSAEFTSLLEAAQQEISSLDKWQAANLRLIAKNHAHATCIDEKILEQHSVICGKSEMVWRQAKRDNNFSVMEEHFDAVFNSVRQITKIKSDYFGVSEYDILLDENDPGRTSLEIKEVYSCLKDQLPGLIGKITEKQRADKLLPLKDKISEETQKQIGLCIVEAMGFDMNFGRLDKSTHPFCSGSKYDTRLTTRYDESNFLTGIFAIIHEAGHGLYTQNLPKEYYLQPAGGYFGMAFHESQSLIMEMQACVSKEFVGYLAKILYDKFDLKYPEYSADNLYKLMTRVQPGFIRVDSDEVTYPLHVILRFEIEQEIIYNNLKAKDLPSLWNAKMQQYLGLIPSTDTLGCLQDIHWPSGSFGYFPSYTNGVIIASMLMQVIKDNHADIYSEIGQGNFYNMNDYLNRKLRNLGSSLHSHELLKNSTGYDKIRPEIFVGYLQSKYL